MAGHLAEVIAAAVAAAVTDKREGNLCAKNVLFKN